MADFLNNAQAANGSNLESVGSYELNNLNLEIIEENRQEKETEYMGKANKESRKMRMNSEMNELNREIVQKASSLIMKEGFIITEIIDMNSLVNVIIPPEEISAITVYSLHYLRSQSFKKCKKLLKTVSREHGDNLTSSIEDGTIEVKGDLDDFIFGDEFQEHLKIKGDAEYDDIEETIIIEIDDYIKAPLIDAIFLYLFKFRRMLRRNDPDRSYVRYMETTAMMEEFHDLYFNYKYLGVFNIDMYGIGAGGDIEDEDKEAYLVDKLEGYEDMDEEIKEKFNEMLFERESIMDKKVRDFLYDEGSRIGHLDFMSNEDFTLYRIFLEKETAWLGDYLFGNDERSLARNIQRIRDLLYRNGENLDLYPELQGIRDGFISRMVALEEGHSPRQSLDRTRKENIEEIFYTTIMEMFRNNHPSIQGLPNGTYPFPRKYQPIEDNSLYDVRTLIPNINEMSVVDSIIKSWNEKQIEPAAEDRMNMRNMLHTDEPGEGVAYHVHNVAERISQHTRFKKLRHIMTELKLAIPSFLGTNEGAAAEEMNIIDPEKIESESLYALLKGIIHFLYSTSKESEKQKRKSYLNYMERLDSIFINRHSGTVIGYPMNDLDPQENDEYRRRERHYLQQYRVCIHDTILFLFLIKEPKILSLYMETLIKECLTAYNDHGNGGSTLACVKGRYERLFTGFGDLISTIDYDLKPYVNEEEGMSQDKLAEIYKRLIEFLATDVKIDYILLKDILLPKITTAWFSVENADNKEGLLSMSTEKRLNSVRKYIIATLREEENLDILEDEKAMREVNKYLDEKIKELLEKQLTKEEFKKDGRSSFFLGGKKTRKNKKKKTKRRKPLKKNKTSSKGQNKKMPRKSKKTKR